MPTAPPTLSYSPPARPGPRPFYLFLLFPASLILALVFFPARPYYLMGLLFKFTHLNVDTAQLPAALLPSIFVLINAAALLHLLYARRRGIILAALALTLSLASLAAALLFWIPAFKA